MKQIKLFDNDLSMDEKIFNYTMVGGIIASSFGFMSTFFSDQPPMSAILSLIWTVFTLISFFVFHKNKKFDIGFVFVCLILNVMGFPSMFFYGGGITGGMPLFFAFGLIFTFLLIKGKKLIPILIFESAIYLACLLVSYYFPQTVIELKGSQARHFDIGLNLYIVSYATGVVMKIVFKQMIREKERVNELNAKLQDMTNKEYMTGLYNRKYLFEKIAEIEARGNGASMIMMDIDKFKRINDKHGHLAGDKVIVGVSSIMKEKFSQGIVCRYGGEEFLAVMENMPLAEAIAISEEVRNKVAVSVFGEIENTTLSFGVGYCPPGEKLELYINVVDERLYTAKKAGRNRVVFTD